MGRAGPSALEPSGSGTDGGFTALRETCPSRKRRSGRFRSRTAGHIRKVLPTRTRRNPQDPLPRHRSFPAGP